MQKDQVVFTVNPDKVRYVDYYALKAEKKRGRHETESQSIRESKESADTDLSPVWTSAVFWKDQGIANNTLYPQPDNTSLKQKFKHEETRK